MGVNRPTPGTGSSSYFGEGLSTVLTWSFTYTVNGDGTWTSHAVPGSVKAVGITGSRAGQTWTIDNFPTFTGYISVNASTLTAATLTPSEEILNFAFTPPVTTYRVCERSEVLINMK